MSVVITAYNRANLIEHAIKSVLAQTFQDFELILVDDGSTDSTIEVAQTAAGNRLKVVRHEINRGIPAARNSGLEQADGRYIAWLDSDDLCRPTRLEEQVAYLECDTDVVMVGAAAGKVTEAGKRARGVRVPPLCHEDICAWLLFRSPFQQSSLLGRAKILKDFPYRPEYPVCEDLDMFRRVTSVHRVRNLPRVLIDRRIHDSQTVRTRQAAIIEATAWQIGKVISRLEMPHTSEDLIRHVMLGAGSLLGHRADAAYLEWSEQWLARLMEANGRHPVVDPQSLRLACWFFWFRAHRGAAEGSLGIDELRQMNGSALWRGMLSGRALRWLIGATPLLLGSRA